MKRGPHREATIHEEQIEFTRSRRAAGAKYASDKLTASASFSYWRPNMIRSSSLFKALLLFAVAASASALGAASDDTANQAKPEGASAGDDAPGKKKPETAPDSAPITPGKLDESLGEVKEITEAVKGSFESVKKSHAVIDKLIKRYVVGDGETFQKVNKEILEQLKTLEKVGRALLKGGPSFEGNLELYDAALKRAEGTHNDLAKLYQRKAVDSKDPQHQKLYRQMSDGAAAAATSMNENRKGMDEMRRNAKKLLDRVEKSQEMISDLRKYFEVFEGVDAVQKEIEKYLANLKAYNKELDTTIDNISKWLQKQEGSSADAPAPSSKPAA
jgi:hypothetical protein